jgi:hypothetical protein
MKTKILFFKPLLMLLLAVVFMTAVIACSNDNGGGGDGDGDNLFNDTPVVSFLGTRWTDNLLPESFIDFDTPTSLTLTGRYWSRAGSEIPGPHYYEVANNLASAAADPNIEGVEPAVWIFTDTVNRKGFEFYLYKAKPETGKRQRIVVYFTGHIAQPREFYLLNE